MPVLNLNASVDEGSFLFSAYGASLSQRRISKKRLLKRKRNRTLDTLLRKKTDARIERQIVPPDDLILKPKATCSPFYPDFHVGGFVLYHNKY